MSKIQSKLGQLLMKNDARYPDVTVIPPARDQDQCQSEYDVRSGSLTISLPLGDYVISKDMSYVTRLIHGERPKQIQFATSALDIDSCDMAAQAQCVVYTNGYDGTSTYKIITHLQDEETDELSQDELHEILVRKWPDWRLRIENAVMMVIDDTM